MKQLINQCIIISRPGHLPFILGATFITFAFVYRFLGLPEPEEMAEIINFFYNTYGVQILFFAAFLEGIFMISFYFPGSFVILLAVFISDKSITDLSYIATLSFLGFVFSVAINYLLGKYGFYHALLWMGKRNTIESMQKWLDHKGRIAIFLSAFHPNFLAIAVVCMGISREGILRTGMSASLSLAFWVPLWTIVAAVLLSQVNIEDPNQHWYIFAAFVVWGVFLIIKAMVKNSKIVSL